MKWIVAGGGRGMAVPFFTEKDEKIQRESKAVFYGQTTVLSTWGSGLSTGMFGTASLGSGLATSTASLEEKSQGIGRLFLTNRRLLFVKDYEKAPKLIFSVPLRAIQSITYQTKMWGAAHGVGLSYVTGQGVQTATFVGLDKKDQPSAESWSADLVKAVQASRNMPQGASSDQKYCAECGKQISRTAKFCPECGAKCA